MANGVNTAAIARVARKLDQLIEKTAKANGISTTVGVHAEDGAVWEPGGHVTIADVAFFAEAGTAREPRRSWLGDTIDLNKVAVDEAWRRVGKKILTKELRPDVGYLQFGEWLVAKIKARVRDHIDPANAASTVAAKGSSTPLIDQSRFLASIRAEIHKRE